MKITFDFSRQQVAIEGEHAHIVEVLTLVQKVAPAISHIQIVQSGSPGSPATPTQGSSNGHQETPHASQNGGSQVQTLRQFARGLQLDNTSERIAAIAYHMKQHDKPTFSPKEMSDWFGICGFQKPAQMPVAVSDAKRKYMYLESAGHGAWKLTTNGDNLVIGKMNQAELTK
jgi:hypothetical protein